MSNTMPDFDPIQTRRDEVVEYTEAIALYTNIAASLPSEWPEHLSHLKGRKDRHAAIAEIDDLADVETVSNLWTHDDAQAAVRANYVERAKAQAILAALESQSQP